MKFKFYIFAMCVCSSIHSAECNNNQITNSSETVNSLVPLVTCPDCGREYHPVAGHTCRS